MLAILTQRGTPYSGPLPLRDSPLALAICVATTSIHVWRTGTDWDIPKLSATALFVLLWRRYIPPHAPVVFVCGEKKVLHVSLLTPALSHTGVPSNVARHTISPRISDDTRKPNSFLVRRQWRQHVAGHRLSSSVKFLPFR